MMDYDLIRKKLLSQVRERLHKDLARLNWAREEIENFQREQFAKLLNHVLEKSSYYQKRCQNIKNLSDIKPSTKQEIMENWNDIICIPHLTKELAEQHLAELRNHELANPFFQDNYYITATGGSSGLRGLFVWDLDYFSIIGYAAFRYQFRDEQINPIKGPKKIAVLTAPTLIHASTPLFSLTLDDESQAVHFPVNENMRIIGDKLNAFQPTHLIGYSSIITEIADRAVRGAVKIAPQRVSTNSEPLEARSRDLVKQAWDLEINNMWGSVEMGMVGIESDAHCGLFLSDDLVIIEAVDQNLQPVQDPAAAQKLLITNLFNFTFPLIRYVVDDAVIIEHSKISGYRLAKDIVGRSDDWFVYANQLKIHPMVFRNILGQEALITEYQVEQTQDGAIIRVIANDHLNSTTLNQDLVRALQDSGLKNPVIKIEKIAELPRHLETGKLKRFIPVRI